MYLEKRSLFTYNSISWLIREHLAWLLIWRLETSELIA